MTQNFKVRNAGIEHQLKDIGRMLHAAMLPGNGFALMICSIGEGGSTFYISDLNREDMKRAIEELLTLMDEKGPSTEEKGPVSEETK